MSIFKLENRQAIDRFQCAISNKNRISVVENRHRGTTSLEKSKTNSYNEPQPRYRVSEVPPRGSLRWQPGRCDRSHARQVASQTGVTDVDGIGA